MLYSPVITVNYKVPRLAVGVLSRHNVPLLTLMHVNMREHPVDYQFDAAGVLLKGDPTHRLAHTLALT